MLDAKLKTQLKAYFERITRPVELAASVDSGAKSLELLALLRDIAALSDKITLVERNDDKRVPSFAVGDSGIRFAGLPMGHEFNSLVLALLQAGGHPPKAGAETIEQVKGLRGEYRFETYFSLTCQNCPDVVQALNLMSVLNPGISHVAIDGGLFQDEIAAREIMAVPAVYLNGEPFGTGRMDLEQIVAKLDTGAAKKEAERIGQKAPYDMLIVGGGPAGAAAAIYAARKGIRTGIATERFGGQVLDTMGIENFISVSQHEGPKLVAALEQHVKDYDVDVMTLQTATGLVPAAEPGGLHTGERRLVAGAQRHPVHRRALADDERPR
jgi:alkyl hydroperoxide reductase subunit F